MEIDFKTVKALSSPTRVRILHKLLDKPSTTTNLSEKTGKSKSTVSSHLSKLNDADLIEKEEEEGRKRVVYHPTQKSEAIVSGREKKVKFSIVSSALSAVTGVVVGFQGLERISLLQDDAPAEEYEMALEAQPAAETSQYFVSGEILVLVGLGLLTVSALALLYGLLIRRLR